MITHKKQLMLILIIALMTTVVTWGSVMAQEEYPGKPVTILVGYNLGGGTDTVVRGFATYLEKYLGVPVKVENMPGASAIIAMNHFYKQPPDGYTLYAQAITSSILSAHLFPDQIEYDFSKVAKIFSFLNGDCSPLSVAGNSGIESFEDLLELAKEKPLVMGGTSFGGVDFTVSVLLRENAGLKDIRYVPYEGSGETIAALLGGHIDCALTSLSTAVNQDEAGQIKIIAVSLPERSVLVPDVPTFIELGYPEVVGTFQIGLFGPPGMEQDTVDIIEAASLRAWMDPGFQEWADGMGIPLQRPYLSREWGELQNSEAARYEKIIPILQEYDPSKK